MWVRTGRETSAQLVILVEVPPIVVPGKVLLPWYYHGSSNKPEPRGSTAYIEASFAVWQVPCWFLTQKPALEQQTNKPVLSRVPGTR